MERKRADIIADELEGLIVDGTMADGERLDEVQLAARFAVSRTPIREALQRLITSGLVEQRPRRGAFVKQPGPAMLVEMFEVMSELEAVCARLAAVRMSDAALKEMGEIQKRSHVTAEVGDADLYYRENEAFHALIYQQSGNSYLERQCLMLKRRLQPYRRLQLRFRGRLQQSMQEHDAIYTALNEGNAERAATLMRQHVSVQGEKFQRLMSELRLAAE